MHTATTVNCKEPILVTFFVLNGPNNLLGTHSVQKLWPDVYSTFISATGCTTPKQTDRTDIKALNAKAQTGNKIH